MIQLILARTVSSLCNCVTYFSGSTRSTGPNFHYRGFNKTRNDQTEYEIDSLLMEDDLVDELAATPLSAEEIAAKLSNSNTKQNPSNLLGVRDANIEGGSIGARGADIWMGGGGSSMGIGGRMERNENKISNDWWSDGEEDEEDEEVEVNGGFSSNNRHNFAVNGDRGVGTGGIGSNQLNEKVINTTFFNSNPTLIGNSVEKNIEEDLYFDENMADISFQVNDSNNNQLQNDNWDKEFFDNYKGEESFDFVPIKENLDDFSIGNADLRLNQVNNEIVFGDQNDPIEYKDFNNNNNNMLSPIIENKDFGDFTSGNSPNNNYIINNRNDIDTRNNEYYESEIGITTLKNNGNYFDQENDQISFSETYNYQINNQVNHIDNQQNNIEQVNNIFDDFSNYNSPEKDDSDITGKFVYSNNNNHEISSSQNQFDFDDFIDTSKNLNDDSIINIGQESEKIPVHNSETVPESISVPISETVSTTLSAPKQVLPVHGKNVIDDFDDIFNSSSTSNDNFNTNIRNNYYGDDYNNNNNSITDVFDFEEKSLQANNNNYSASTYEDDEFGIFDFVSAKSPPANDPFKSDFLSSDRDSNKNNQQTSILL
ncbi:unnamed protein product [Cryptosporidium hominis]|uniref:Uncharacterized protein n=1 Tax=Cryptosporidium hominis TaxID=237895 RepID=A0A0S4TCG7_CRYHO|nr:Uncharacterized protein GY17_00003530 [Cryptosporidium hominis]CUV04731.1 unnamed protein product [Cryptosporidium hominis]|eukprot:PPS94475.1 Uncharacterized protein GY17_00003530 [Cryptosporidium hominis]